ncbi:hypothetical protein [Prevotella brunnea]|uniref:hypothetical protein n=1 Tax=Prevotella brunnea TaxID=2508867 RepID=UPI00283AAFF5|nr:hypothetical protein [Prevotella brunnea]
MQSALIADFGGVPERPQLIREREIDKWFVDDGCPTGNETFADINDKEEHKIPKQIGSQQ